MNLARDKDAARLAAARLCVKERKKAAFWGKRVMLAKEVKEKE